MKYLETARLLIRNFDAEDLDELVDYRSNVLCSKYQRGQYRDRDYLAVFIEEAKEGYLVFYRQEAFRSRRQGFQ